MIIDEREWLETDGLGGFAMGTASGVRTRRYHGLLIHATTPPTGRMVLVNGVDARVEIDGVTTNLSTQRYAPDVLHPDGAAHLDGFSHEPWPTWRWRVGDGLVVTQELFMPHGAGRVVLRWHLQGSARSASLQVRPFLSGRDYHSMHHENSGFDFSPRGADGDLEWRPYPGVPGVRCLSNGRYSHRPEWYRNFLYSGERARGLDATEDLAAPGELQFDLAAGDAVCVLEPTTLAPTRGPGSVVDVVARLRQAELTRRGAFPSRLHFSADQYLVKRGAGHTIVAGYPWFTDWGRDTFIALRGLCIAAGRLAEARDILLEWAGTVSDGMLPNRFPDGAGEPEFNAVDASLWFVIAVRDLLEAVGRKRLVPAADRERLMAAVDAILNGYARGTRFGIRVDTDGLVAAGVPGVQLTWMDAKVGDEVVTPRIGKPVEIQALWINALGFAGRSSPTWRALHDRAMASFREKFWNDDRECLYDVIDVDHVPGRVDGSLRPNQILAVGGLGECLLDDRDARRVVEAVERTLVTPAGLRSLAPGEPGYTPRYEGGPWQRDHAYHQGTVWPWLVGPFVDAWIHVRGGHATAAAEAATRFVEPFTTELQRAGLGHLFEVADAEAPHHPGGCPFQAWSVGELLRLRCQMAPAPLQPGDGPEVEAGRLDAALAR